MGGCHPASGFDLESLPGPDRLPQEGAEEQGEEEEESGQTCEVMLASCSASWAPLFLPRPVGWSFQRRIYD